MTNPFASPTSRPPLNISAALLLPARRPAAIPPARTSESGRAENDVLDERLAPYALWFLRLALGAFFLEHVMHVVFGYVPLSASQLFGLPPGSSWIALAWDTLIALALLYGLWPRLAAIAGAATLVVAVATHHSGVASEFGWQHVTLGIAALLAVALGGDGVLALVPSRSGFGRRRQ